MKMENVTFVTKTFQVGKHVYIGYMHKVSKKLQNQVIDVLDDYGLVIEDTSIFIELKYLKRVAKLLGVKFQKPSDKFKRNLV